MHRTALALVVFAGWAAVTAFSGRIWETVHGPQALIQNVSERIAPSLIAALVFLGVAIWLFGWRDVGLNRPRHGTLKLLWFPALYVGLFLAALLLVGLPPLPVLLIVLANTAMVGVSEELACRGVLYQGLRARFSLWAAILATALLFGALHLVNGFTTGDFPGAAVQAVTAFMTGIAFMGIRLRTGSLYPAMALHGVWDFALVSLGAGAAIRHGIVPGSGMDLESALVPMLFILPNFLYGLFLMRHAARDEGK